MGEVTQLLGAAAEGDRRAIHELLPQVYEELRRLAAARLAAEKPGQTLQPTVLVHEAYLRLVAGNEAERPSFANRRHFFAAAAEAMRRILIDQARRKKTAKHGGEGARISLSAVEPPAPEEDHNIERLSQALEELNQHDPAAAELVSLRWFGGQTMPQVADLLGLSLRSAERQWAYARAWLYQRIKEMD
jgi:RNA polymerase sigma factor (TIGR02999 family)